MTEINTFSAAVDACIVRSGQPHRRADLISYLRQTIRETEALAFFRPNFVEATLAANADPYVWVTPVGFRLVRAVQYADWVDDQGNPIYVRNVPPGRKMNSHRWLWYGSGDSLVFVGHAGSALQTATINIAYYMFSPPLAYYAAAERPATYSLETATWSYLTAVTDQEKEAAQAQVTNWLIKDWFDTILEGALAKLYKTNGDQRAVTSFALYKQQQDTIRASIGQEAFHGEG